MNKDRIRNVAIIAHVDHGKTTLVDGLLKQSHTFRDNQAEMSQTLIMDSMDQEHERGITITAKQTSVYYNDYKINIIDTPGHADFSGEVERTLNMADGVLLIVDAQEGPMPQTKFVLQKALGLHLKPVVIINKIDKPAARIEEVKDEISDLFLELATDESQLNYPIYYAIARDGKAGKTTDLDDDLHVIFESIINDIPAPKTDDNEGAGAQLLVAALAADNYLGKYAIGKIFRGRLKKGQSVKLMQKDTVKPAKIEKIFTYRGLGKEETEEAIAGDIVALTGVAEANIGDTIATGENPEALPTIELEPPTLSIYIGPNTSPLKGKEGEFTTSRQIAERLERELETNIALKIQPDGLGYKVSGRGELHLSVLIETMRREGYELQVGQPKVIVKEIDGKKCEPVEQLTILVPEEFSSKVIDIVTRRKGDVNSIDTKGDRVQLEFTIPSRGIIGLRNNLLTVSNGEAIIAHRFKAFEPWKGEMGTYKMGALIAKETGTSTAYSISKLQDRGQFFIEPGEDVYAGQVVGEGLRPDNDIVINVIVGKNLTNMRSKSADDKSTTTPATKFSLEEAMEYIREDEYLEITPTSLRIRKIILDEIARKRSRQAMEENDN